MVFNSSETSTTPNIKWLNSYQWPMCFYVGFRKPKSDIYSTKIIINSHYINRRAQAPCACRSLAFHFRPTSCPFPVHLGLGPIDGHMRCPIIQFFKKINFAKFADGHTAIVTNKTKTTKTKWRTFLKINFSAKFTY